MKKLFILCIAILFLGACSSDWEIDTIVDPDITYLDERKLSLVYRLGPVLIVDTIWVSEAWANYIKSNDDTAIRLHATEDSCDCSKSFKYYIEGNIINSGSAPINTDVLEEHADEIPGFTWLDGRSSAKSPKELL